MIWRPEYYFGTKIPLPASATSGEVDQRRLMAGSEFLKQSGWNYLTGIWTRRSSLTTTRVDTPDASGDAVLSVFLAQLTIEDNKYTGSRTETYVSGTVRRELAVDKMKSTVRQHLEALLEDPKLSGQLRARTEGDIRRLEKGDAKMLEAIIQAYRFKILPQYHETGGKTTTEKTTSRRFYLGRTRETEVSEPQIDGSRKLRKEARGWNIDLLGGTGHWSRDDPTVGYSRDDGSSDAKKKRTEHGVGVANGRFGYNSKIIEVDQVLDKDENVVSGTSNMSKSGLGIVSGELGPGLGFSNDFDVSSSEKGVTTRFVGQRSTQYTGQGVRDQRSLEVTHTGEHVTVGTKVSSDGVFRVTITQVPHSIPREYQVMTEIALTGSVGSSGGRAPAKKQDEDKKRLSISGSLETTGGVVLKFARVLDAAEALQYETNANAADAGKPPGENPEFNVISRVRALRQQENALQGLRALLGDAESAKSLRDGETIEMSLTGDLKIGATVGLGGKLYGGSLGGESLTGLTRTIKIARTPVAEAKGQHMVDVTVTFGDRSSQKASVAGLFEGLSLGFTGSEAGSRSENVVVRLDTRAHDYSEKYMRAIGALTPNELRELAATTTRERTDQTSILGTAGLINMQLILGGDSHSKESVTVDHDDGRLSGTVSGGQTFSGGVSVFDIKLFQGSRRDTATTTVERSGAETVLDTEYGSSDLWRTIRESVSAVYQWFIAPSVTINSAASAVTKSPKEHIQQQLEKQYSWLSRYALSEADVLALAERSSDTREWDRHTRLRLLEPWRTLGRTLRAPPIDRGEAAIDLHDALHLARGRVLSEWLENYGSAGMESLESALRYWHQHDGVESARDLGVHLEWPESLRTARSNYELAHFRLQSAEDHLSGLLHSERALSDGYAWYNDTQTKLASTLVAIQANDEISDLSAKLEMIDVVQRELADLDTVWQAHFPSLVYGAPMSALDAPGSETDTRRRRMADILTQLAQYKKEEQRGFARACDLLPVELHGNLENTWSNLGKQDFLAAQAILGQIGLLHEGWISRVIELRSIYRALDVPNENWLVSDTAGRRSPVLEPDMRRLYLLYVQTDGSPAVSLTMDRRQRTASGWYERWNSY